MTVLAKKIICLLLVPVICIGAFSGCSGGSADVPEMTLSDYVPKREGDEDTFTAQLYFVSDDGLHLSIEEREVRCGKGMSRAEAAIGALIDGPVTTVLNQSVPGDMLLQRVETSYEACNVYLLASYTPDARTWATAQAAIAATVYACENIASINLYLNGMAPAYYGRAMGAVTPISNTLDAYIVELQQQYTDIAQGTDNETGAGVYETRIATLYFTDSSNTLLIAKNVPLNYDSTETSVRISYQILNKLLDGAEGLEAVLPADLQLHSPIRLVPEKNYNYGGNGNFEDGESPHPSETAPEIEKPEDQGLMQGEPMVAEIVLEKPKEKYDEDILSGALTLTLTGYIPDLIGVSITMIDEDGKITELAPDGYFTREDFSGRIGRIVNIDCPNRDGSLLYRASRAVSSEESYDPMAILTELLSGSTDLGGMCGGFTADDISGVYKTDNTIVIDWKAGFTDKLRAYINSEDDTGIPQENRERAFIYSIVNTLTEIEDIGRVWMLEDGKKLGSIDKIYLGNSLMRNPGILVNE